SGSAGLDLAVSTTTTINDTSVHLIPIGLTGPLPFKCHALPLGKLSSSKTGLFILPGIIDSDSRGEIKIMAWTPNPPCTIPAGSCIAQLIPLPILPDMQFMPSVNADRGTEGFGSTGTPNIYLSKLISVQQPFLTCLIDGKSFTGLIDIGADITIIN
ncbi:POK9 protein, partial [Ptilorrhoa leucosticta]|nr:POK9 protein [Ptilorrhoa leucosticta]